MAKADKISKIINKLIKNKQLVNVTNITVKSLFQSGGTISDSEAKKYIDNYVGIGFDQPKFYIPSAWRKAKVLMEYLIVKKKVIAKNYGRGKGKYDTAKGQTITSVKGYLKK
tara:strand:+ start:1108 stop:1443 length:336 start_codon:yes stop_codon:yes gene_type:complete